MQKEQDWFIIKEAKWQAEETR